MENSGPRHAFAFDEVGLHVDAFFMACPASKREDARAEFFRSRGFSADDRRRKRDRLPAAKTEDSSIANLLQLVVHFILVIGRGITVKRSASFIRFPSPRVQPTVASEAEIALSSAEFYLNQDVKSHLIA